MFDIYFTTLQHVWHIFYYHATCLTYILLPCSMFDIYFTTLQHVWRIFYYPATCLTYILLPCNMFDIYNHPNMFITCTKFYMYVQVPIKCAVTPTFFTGGKAAGAWCWTLTPSSAEVVYEYSYVSSSLIRLHDILRVTLTFIFHILRIRINTDIVYSKVYRKILRNSNKYSS